jgi:hypothetical protein
MCAAGKQMWERRVGLLTGVHANEGKVFEKYEGEFHNNEDEMLYGSGQGRWIWGV